MPPVDMFTCKTCGDEFTRIDHLTRHVRSHNADRPFACPICSKPFGRSDSLARHIRGHDAGINKPGGHRTIFNRISRACTNCSKSKVRCDGKQPCQHCASRKLQCVREARQKRKTKPPNSSFRTAQSSAEPEEISLYTPISDSSSHRGFSGPSPPANNAATLPPSTQNFAASRGRSPDREGSLLRTPISPNDHDIVYSGFASTDHVSSNQHSHIPPAFNAMDIETTWDHQFTVTDWMTLDLLDPLDFFINGQLLHPLVSDMSLHPTHHPPGVANLPIEPSTEYPGHLEGVTTTPHGHGPVFTPDHINNISSGGRNSIPGGLQGDQPGIDRPLNKICPPKGRSAFVSFPDFNDADFNVLQAENFGHVGAISQQTYDEAMQGVNDVCDGLHASQRFKISTFPPRPVLNCFIQLYFEYFQPVFPIIHPPTFNTSQSHWLEVLAVAAVGCRFSKAKQSLKCTHALLWLLGRSIHQLTEVDYSVVRTVWFTNSMLLNHIGMMYSGDKRLLEMGLVIGNCIATQCRRDNYLKEGPQAVKISESTCGLDLETNWSLWVREEGRRRIGYGCWILQCQLPLHFDLPASMRLSELRQNLPCPDSVWHASSASEWKLLFLQYQKDSQSSPLTINSVLHDLISHKRVSKAVGDFGLLALVHAIHETTFEMRISLKNPLFRGLSGSSPFIDDTNFQQWQVRAGELLEVLSPLGKENDLSNTGQPRNASNWQFRQYISTSAHHVSLLVFVPIGDLLNFAGSEINSTEKRYAEQQLLNWVADDNGRTARRAVLHACIIFSLIRSRSCYNFNEPIAFLVATMTIWSYNYLSPVSASGLQYRRQTTIRLDKTWSQEAAELWLDGEPEDTRGYLTDIGNINEQTAGKRLLQVAHQTLLDLPAWGLSQGFAQFLDRFQGQMHQ